ncbi:MAG TPA: rhodanese-like domain-containing protein [Candidatus Binataceae bacterium]|jgi:rhodanese-related sulfurtransferase
MDNASAENAGAAPADDVREISRGEIERRLGDSAMRLVDVLPREAYAAEHIPGAINIPLTEVQARAPEVIPDRGADIITYCAKFT